MKKLLTRLGLLCYFFIIPYAWPQSSEIIDVKYCVDPAWAPYESIENNQHIGISKQYLSLFEQLTPLRFTLVTTSTWEETLALIQTEQCQLMPMLNRSAKREQFMVFSDIYFRAPNALYGHYDQVMVGNISSITTQTVAVVAGYRMHHYLEETFPHLNIITVANEEAGLVKVAAQEVDYFVGSFYAANKIIQQRSLAQLRIVGLAELEDNLRMGVAKDSTYLLPYINQAISQISAKDHNKVFSYLKMSNLVKQTDYAIVLKTIIAFSIITILLLAGYFHTIKHAKVLADKNKTLKTLHDELAKKNHQLAELAIRDHLTQLYNRGHLAEVIEQQIRLKHRYNTSACLLMIDIDDFKQINDTLGHKTGDDILKQFADILGHSARDSDIVARWGGEEFMMLCPETEPSEATRIAQRFQQTLKDAKTDTMPTITCSIGIAELSNTANAEQWFVSADNAMYYAKKQGKNTVHCLHCE